MQINTNEIQQIENLLLHYNKKYTSIMPSKKYIISNAAKCAGCFGTCKAGCLSLIHI